MAEKTSKKVNNSKKNKDKINEKTVGTYIEETVLKFLPEPDGMSDKVRDAMVYAVEAGGKRVRPTLMYLTYKAFSLSNKDKKKIKAHDKVIENFMAALEMIHTVYKKGGK